LSANITGQNIGYIYLFIGLYDPQSNSILVADTDFLESPDAREAGGIFYPAWPDSETFNINFEWDASLFSITDGSTSSLALFNPLTYGGSAQDAVYVVNGTYTFTDTGQQQRAQLHFIDGKLAQVLGFNTQDQTGAPAEISPSDGDTFTIVQKWLELDSNGKVTQAVYEPGETLTFSSGTSFTWETVYAPVGEYLVGFLTTDQDGNASQAFTQITMQ
jgi:hypothetical protein